mgnify:CR=1 FL=1
MVLGINIYCYTTTPKYNNRATISAVLAGGAAVKDTVPVGILEEGVCQREVNKEGSRERTVHWLGEVIPVVWHQLDLTPLLLAPLMVPHFTSVVPSLGLSN